MDKLEKGYTQIEEWAKYTTLLPELIDRCSEITKSKGFDVTQHRTQLCLMVTEIAEALAHVSDSYNVPTNIFRWEISEGAEAYEEYRHKSKFKHTDRSIVFNKPELLEELSDTLIRIFSYVGGNGWRDEFIKALQAKIEKNKERPYKHGKGF